MPSNEPFSTGAAAAPTVLCTAVSGAPVPVAGGRMGYSRFTLNSPLAGAIGAISRSGSETSLSRSPFGSSVRWPTGWPSNPCWPSSAPAPDESSAPASATSAAETSTAAARRRLSPFLIEFPPGVLAGWGEAYDFQVDFASPLSCSCLIPFGFPPQSALNQLRAPRRVG